MGWGGMGWGGEASSTGHQLLSDYIIPDIKTTHTDRVPVGGPRKEGEGGVWASLAPPQPIPILTPRPLAGEEMGPHPCATSGPHPAEVSSGVAAGRLRAGPTHRQPRGAPRRRRRPGDCSAGPRGGGGAARGRRWPASPQHPHGPPAAHPQPLTCAALRLRSPFTWSSPRPPPARPRRLRWLLAGPGSRWAFREGRGGGAGCPRPGGRILPRRGRRPPGGAARAAALCAPGELSVRLLKRRAPGRERTRGSEGTLPLLLRPAGGRVSAAFGHDDPSSSPAAAPSPPAPLLTDGATATTRRRRRGCSQLLTLMLRPLQPQPRARTGRDAR